MSEDGNLSSKKTVGKVQKTPEKTNQVACDEFKKLIEDTIIKTGVPVKIALFAHRAPDPDAIGSMMGLEWLLNRLWTVEIDKFYDGEVSHPQNGVMNNILDPGLKRVNEEYKPDKYHLHILLDTIPSNAGIGKFTDVIKFDCVIDHHRDLPPSDFAGLVIHRKVGSCCGIVYDMIKGLVPQEHWFDDDADGDSKVATAMIAGVVSDTDYMLADDSTELEFQAFSELFPYRNSNFLKQIVFFKRPKFWIDMKSYACGHAVVDDEGYAIVGLGLIPEKQRDLIADIAEEMITWSSVETAIAFGVVGGDRIEGSVRSLNASLTVADFCKKLGGKTKFGSGGGKHGSGAYRMDIGGMSIDPDEDEEVIKQTCACINNKETKRISRLIKSHA